MKSTSRWRWRHIWRSWRSLTARDRYEADEQLPLPVTEGWKFDSQPQTKLWETLGFEPGHFQADFLIHHSDWCVYVFPAGGPSQHTKVSVWRTENRRQPNSQRGKLVSVFDEISVGPVCLPPFHSAGFYDHDEDSSEFKGCVYIYIYILYTSYSYWHFAIVNIHFELSEQCKNKSFFRHAFLTKFTNCFTFRMIKTTNIQQQHTNNEWSLLHLILKQRNNGLLADELKCFVSVCIFWQKVTWNINLNKLKCEDDLPTLTTVAAHNEFNVWGKCL